MGASADRVVTFVVRIVETPVGVHAVVERVRTGLKQRVDSIEAIGPAIAAMALKEQPTRLEGGTT